MKKKFFKKVYSLSLVLIMCTGHIQEALAENLQIPDQGTRITGTVLNVDGSSLIGASVAIKGSTVGTVTDLDGKYSIQSKSASDVLVFSYLGKQTQEIVAGSQAVVNVRMEDNDQMLQEVVIQTGYMMQKKADLTGAIAMATAQDLVQNPSGNAMKSLQGKLPGVLITTNGNPASDVAIQIRGITSLNAAPPLIIVDGLPADINLRDINTFDIESIQVLKDAAAASIYGSRAASGVILIETKKGKKGQTTVSYDGSLTVSKLNTAPQMLNTEQYGRGLWQANVNDGNDPNLTVRIYDYDWGYNVNGYPALNSLNPVEWLNSTQTMPSADTDWFNEITRTGIQQNHQVTVSNGNDKSSSMFSLNYFNDQGTQIDSYFKRYSVRLNTDYNLIDNRLKIGENLGISYLDYKDAQQTYNALIMPSIVPVYTTDGQWGGSAMELGMDDFWNPVRELEVNKKNNEQFMKLIGSAYLDLSLFKGLNFKTQFGIDYSNAYHRHIDYTWKEGGGKFDDQGGVENNQQHTVTSTWTNTFNYSLNKGKHRLDAVAGTEYIHYGREGFYAYGDNILLYDRDYAVLDRTTGTKRRNIRGWFDEWSLFSYFAKANYVFDNKYLLSATVRYDGSSKFGQNNRWGLFPAFSVGWRIREESFMNGFDFLSDLKLRASWGQNGNSNIPTTALQNIYYANYGSFLIRTSYALQGQATGELPSGYYRDRLGNPNLKWEATEQTNLGVDFGFLNQEISGSLDYFYKETKGMLYEPPYIGAFGEGGYQYINAANMNNRGIEFILNYHNKTQSGFEYTISGNFATYKNTIVDVPEEALQAYGGNGMLDNILGRPKNSHYGFIADGIFKTQEEVDNSPQQEGKGLGRIRYKDLDGDGRITNEYDRTWIGVWDPDFSVGLNFNAVYKGIDLTLFFHGVFGNDIYNEWKVYSDFWNITEQSGKNHPARIMDAWSFANPDSDIPALSTQNLNNERRLSTYFIEDGSYLKLRTAEIGYTFPDNLIDALSLNRLRIYASAQNIFTMKAWWSDNMYSGPDPEIIATDRLDINGFGYLRPFSLIFGVNITF
jgi:TonB-linked SusC/RagA family outer membrane protein